jgi:hypothetical protein
MVAAISCLDFSTSPDEVLYLAFERLPFPSVVAGDTLRDSTGNVALLEATAVTAGGDDLPAGRLRFYAVGDTGEILDVDSLTGRIVSGAGEPRSVGVIASVGSLQSTPLPLSVTKSPDSLHLELTTDTIVYSFVDTTRNFSDPIAVKLLHHDSTTFYSGVTGWVLRFSLEDLGDSVAVSLVDDTNRRLRTTPTGFMHIDTTTADGSASRKVRVRPGPPLGTPLDSVAIVVEAKYRGVQVAGSPARLYIFMRPST